MRKTRQKFVFSKKKLSQAIFNFMRLRLSFSLLLTVLFACLAPLQAAELVLPGCDGAGHRPLNVPAGKKGVVVLFASPFCNTSNTFLSEWNAITEAFEDRFLFYLAHPEAGLKLEQVMEHRELLAVRSQALLDEGGRLARQLGARVTPEVALIGPDGSVLYQGRINDLYLTATRRQRKATTTDLRDALEAVAAGKPVAEPRTEAVGCKISGID